MRTLDEDASSFIFADAANMLLAHGTSWDLGGEAGSLGLGAYTLDGRERFRLFRGKSVFVEQAAGPYAYVEISDGDGPSRWTIDLRSGRVAGEDLPWANLIARPRP